MYWSTGRSHMMPDALLPHPLLPLKEAISHGRPKNRVYSETLSQTDMTSGTNSFYKCGAKCRPSADLAACSGAFSNVTCKIARAS